MVSRKAFLLRASLLAMLLSVAGTAQAQSLTVGFSPSALTVAVGGTVTAVLSLAGVPAGATVTVALSTSDERKAQVMPQEVVFDASMTAHTVTIRGVSEGSATVTAMVSDAAIAASGLPAGSTVESAHLPITITPAYRLVFDPPSVTVVVGERETVKLRLPGVPAGVRVTVNVGLSSGVANAEIVAGDGNLRFTPDRLIHDVTILGVAAGSAQVRGIVTGINTSLSDAPEDGDVDLQVTVKTPGLRLRVWALLEGPLQ